MTYTCVNCGHEQLNHINNDTTGRRIMNGWTSHPRHDTKCNAVISGNTICICREYQSD